MPQLSRQGDKNQTGGKIMRGAGTVFCNGIPVGLHVSQISDHDPHGKNTGQHRAATTTSASPTVYAEGSQVLRVTSGNSCGHSIIQGSDNVFCP
jgi:uncharacterized Zn-binding protein involved in type VI secretion